MAEAEASGTISSTTIDGSFSLKKSPCTISLTTDHLKWKETNGKQNEEIVPITDVLSVKADGPKEGVVDRILVHYIKRKKKHILRKTCAEFRGTSDACTEWNKHIQGRIDAIVQRPRRLLVLVNPISGFSKGRKVYFQTVAPLFQLAGIQTDVIVTEKAHHTEEILAKYDLKSIDGLVLVGGDGLYHEAVNGFLQRSGDESGIDRNDPDAVLPDISVPMGIIPCGTGNGIAECNNGNKDVETSALSIIVGKTNTADYFGVYSCGSLISYASLLVGYGVWGDMIYRAESRRSQGVLRYPIAISQVLLISPQRHIDCSFECLPPKPTRESAEQPIWTRMNEVNIGLVTFVMNIFHEHQPDDSEPTTSMGISICKPCSRWAFIKNMVNLMTLNKEAVDRNVYQTHTFSQYKVKLTNPSDPESWNGRMEHILNIDGEIFQLKQPEYHVTHHPDKIQMFANVPKEWVFMTKSQRNA